MKSTKGFGALAIFIVIALSIGAAAIWYYEGAQDNQTLSLPPVTTSTQPAQGGVSGPGEPCGGNIASPKTCEAGYHCGPSPAAHAPFGDVGGICIQDSASAGGSVNATTTTNVRPLLY